jgi:hypothetical protein
MSEGELLAYAWGYDQARQASALIDTGGDLEAFVDDRNDPAWRQFAADLEPDVITYWVARGLDDFTKSLLR